MAQSQASRTSVTLKEEKSNQSVHSVFKESSSEDGMFTMVLIYLKLQIYSASSMKITFIIYFLTFLNFYELKSLYYIIN